MSPWSFVGRTEELKRLAAATTGGTGRGVIFSGSAGVGKSRLLREGVAVLPAERYAIHCASANTAAAGLPFGGLAQVLPADPPPSLAPAGLLRWAVDALHQKAAGRPHILAVDDAHLLDASSAALVYLMARQGTTVLATLRSGEQVPLSIRALWTDDLVDHVELEPMNVAEATAMLAAMLDGPIEPASAERLWRLSSGNPLMLRELLLAATGGDEITQVYGMWRWTGRLELAPSLVDMVDHRIGSLDAAVRTVVELTALGEPIGLDLIMKATSPEAVEDAEERGLIRVVADDRRTQVRLGHPLYGEVVRRQCPVTRARRLHRVLADLVERAGARRRDDLLRVAVWRLESGTAHDAVQLHKAGAQAFARYDMPLALRLTRAALQAGGGFETAVLLSRILMFSDRSDEAMRVVERFRDDDAPDDRRARWFASRASVRYWGLGQIDAVEQLAADVDTIDDPAARARLQGFEALMRLHRKDCEEAQRLARAILDRPTSGAAARALALSTVAYLHAVRGEFRQSARAVATVEADAAQWRQELPSLQMPVEMARGIRMVLAGDLPGIDGIVMDEFADLAEAGDFRHGSGHVLLLRAHAAALRGQTGESLRIAAQACAAFASSQSYHGGAHAARAYAAALRGEAELAAAAIWHADDAQSDSFAVLYPPVEQARAWVRAVTGDLAGAVEQLRGLAARLRRDRFAAHEVLAWHDVVRLGRPELAVEALDELAGTVQGPLSQLIARQARAAADGTPDELLAVAREYEQRGLLLYAAEAAAIAVGRLRAVRGPGVEQASTQLADLLERCDVIRTPALAAVQPSLTGREREIARLAATGMASRQIADQLFLSARTVENHLQRIYTKLGITGRGALAAALRALPD